LSLKDRLNKSNIAKESSVKEMINDAHLSGLLSSEVLDLKEKLHSILVDKINSTPAWEKYSDDEQKQIIRHYIEKRLTSDHKAIPLNKNEREILIRGILQEIKGYGPLDPLLKDSTISDILVNGPKHIYIEKEGKLYKTAVNFKDDAHLMNIIERMVSRVGRRIDEKSPMVDARLQDGSRINAIIPPLAIDGPSLSIRRFKIDAANIDSLLKWGAMTVAMADTLKAAVKSKLNIVISGGTGAGKTTLLNSLSSQIPNDERIITIEDSAELSLQQEHVVRLETRPSNIEGTGAVTTRDLVINALRMRPDRIIIGECRGAETLDMLQAMNTGHDGSLTTLHSNTPRDALNRLETMVLFSGVELPEKTIRSQISSAVHILVQVSRLSDGSRRVTHITEIVGTEGNTIVMQDIFKWEQQGIDENGKVIGHHIASGVRPKFAERCKSKGINLPLNLFDPSVAPVYLCANPPNKKLIDNQRDKLAVERTRLVEEKVRNSTNNPLINRLKK
jgi:pilus assembly protein CpaF